MRCAPFALGLAIAVTAGALQAQTYQDPIFNNAMPAFPGPIKNFNPQGGVVEPVAVATAHVPSNLPPVAAPPKITDYTPAADPYLEPAVQPPPAPGPVVVAPPVPAPMPVHPQPSVAPTPLPPAPVAVPASAALPPIPAPTPVATAAVKQINNPTLPDDAAGRCPAPPVTGLIKPGSDSVMPPPPMPSMKILLASNNHGNVETSLPDNSMVKVGQVFTYPKERICTYAINGPSTENCKDVVQEVFDGVIIARRGSMCKVTEQSVMGWTNKRVGDITFRLPDRRQTEITTNCGSLPRPKKFLGIF